MGAGGRKHSKLFLEKMILFATYDISSPFIAILIDEIDIFRVTTGIKPYVEYHSALLE